MFNSPLFSLSILTRTTQQNNFHWHVVDSQSFPLVIPGYEELASQGAYSPDEVYTPDQVADLVQYANEVRNFSHHNTRLPFGVIDLLNFQRGINVIAEIDTPGHTSVISKAFPEHVACPDASPWIKYANEPPSGQLRLASPETVKFTASLLANAAKLFPGSYFGTGGDEINVKCYADDSATQQALNGSGKTFEQALDTFTQVGHKALKDAGKTAVVWQEMA
jgi:hexosaminidase